MDQSKGRTFNVLQLFASSPRYINGNSFVLRHANEPFTNLFSDETLITRNRVENTEKSLKRDVMIETRRGASGGNIIIHDEEALRCVSVYSCVLSS